MAENSDADKPQKLVLQGEALKINPGGIPNNKVCSKMWKQLQPGPTWPNSKPPTTFCQRFTKTFRQNDETFHRINSEPSGSETFTGTPLQPPAFPGPAQIPDRDFPEPAGNFTEPYLGWDP